MAIKEERLDIIEGLLKKKDELNLSVEKLVLNVEILIIGGSETTASLLYEVRSMFHSEDEIDLVSVNKLSYMLACLDEGMRMYPPIANGLLRVCLKGGSRVLGEYIPEFVYSLCLRLLIWALYRREKHFKDPNNIHPERFLGFPEFVDDRRDIF
ncbi:hypothetical protein N7507_002559 [Penicillium longicatenatum]|nr:hypothetical protein N7507_002559 [Penicillium longicatenatum]